MSLIVNGTTIPETLGQIVVGGVDVTKVVAVKDGVSTVVWDASLIDSNVVFESDGAHNGSVTSQNSTYIPTFDHITLGSIWYQTGSHEEETEIYIDYGGYTSCTIEFKIYTDNLRPWWEITTSTGRGGRVWIDGTLIFDQTSENMQPSTFAITTSKTNIPIKSLAWNYDGTANRAVTGAIVTKITMNK